METPLNLTCDLRARADEGARRLGLIWYDRGQLAVRRIGDDVTLGADPRADVWIEGDFVSRRHCRIIRRGRRWQVVDCSSRNGTFLGGVAIERKTLDPPALLMIGAVRITVVEEVESPHTAPYYRFGSMVGRAAATLGLFHEITRCADNLFPVLIGGPTGCGKELCARALHDLSPRSGKPFVPLNCAALPADLAEAELFGAVRGAYTGAQSDREGVFRAADGGTLFLDEVGDLSPAVQAKLLRALECGLVRPVGSHREVRVDVRVISATNLPIHDPLRFRHDLYHRLAGLSLQVRALDERPDDVTALFDHFACAEGLTGLDSALFDAVSRRRYSGNARELRQFVRRLVVCGPQLELAAFSTPLEPTLQIESYQSHGVPECEAFRILTALRAHGGNRAQTARALGIPRSTFFFKLRRIEQGLAPHQRHLLSGRRRSR
ncbi:MAG: sigma 54-interacting transcriptional regulator [Myxococcales bacterium]|nr:sigma 54-interacting transcriptional regulator [Myxococcales bacterium]